MNGFITFTQMVPNQNPFPFDRLRANGFWNHSTAVFGVTGCWRFGSGLSGLRGTVHHVMGEHDYYLDLGEYWEKLFGPQHYSFDHEGLHFVVLNSILTDDDWTHHRWPSASQRMLEMAGLDNPNGSPVMVGEKQREWLTKDLDKVDKNASVVVLSHSPLQKICKGWNFCYILYDNPARTVAFNTRSGQPEDTQYQVPENRVPAQNHY